MDFISVPCAWYSEACHTKCTWLKVCVCELECVSKKFQASCCSDDLSIKHTLFPHCSPTHMPAQPTPMHTHTLSPYTHSQSNNTLPLKFLSAFFQARPTWLIIQGVKVRLCSPRISHSHWKQHKLQGIFPEIPLCSLKNRLKFSSAAQYDSPHNFFAVRTRLALPHLPHSPVTLA